MTLPMLRRLSTAALLGAALTIGAAGCGDRVHIGGDDAGTVADGGGEACGSVTCGPGRTCCNASCGICTLPGEGCPAIACVDGGPAPDAGCPGAIDCARPPPGCDWVGGDFCTTCGTLVCGDRCGGLSGLTCTGATFCDFPSDSCGIADEEGTCSPRPDECPTIHAPVCGCDGATYGNSCVAHSSGVDVLHDGPCSGGGICDPMDAAGDGLCDAFFGYAWTGSACVGISGCSCVGADCGALYSDSAACESAHVSCGGTGTVCGTIAGLTCASTEWCDYGGAGGCRMPDAGGACRVRPTACPEVYSPVCGCDGHDYDNGCFAHSAGTDVLHAGTCASSCAPMDASGVGPCAAFFGYAWNGSACVGLSGCSCAGMDCASTFATPEDCARAYAGCPSTSPPVPGGT